MMAKSKWHFQAVGWILATGLMATSLAHGGGGMVLRDDICVIEIDFYDAQFTAYQPQSRGDSEFCQVLPDVGETRFVLDYLHPSLKDVPVDFRIIRNTSDMGDHVNLADVDSLGDLTALTLFYHPPSVRPGGNFQISYGFDSPGRYIGLVTAGHPTNHKTYRAAFPFSVGLVNYRNLTQQGFWLATVLSVLWLVWRRYRKPKQGVRRDLTPIVES